MATSGSNLLTREFINYKNNNLANSSYTNSTSEYVDEDGMRKEQDLLLPIANVGRIIKQNLPPNAKVSKEAKETIQECVSEFISFVTGAASDKCKKEKRKTVSGDDICWALENLGFDDFTEPLRMYLNRFREFECDKNKIIMSNNEN
ncbi:hypothetical protein Leryth_004085 [Lithospermum erythrorhizon]|nr:hypothetical protein Leryth_004085 [Lithospermum erythrorhizon]